jgi:hypothetical protein
MLLNDAAGGEFSKNTVGTYPIPHSGGVQGNDCDRDARINGVGGGSRATVIETFGTSDPTR